MLSSFLDVTQKAKKSDIIISLGGDTNLERIKVSLNLLKNNFSKSNKILLTGYNEKIKYANILNKTKRMIFLNNNKISDDRILHAFNTKNTYMEITYIKRFVKNTKYNSVIIVTDEPHSKRVDLLIKLISPKNTFNYTIVGTGLNCLENNEILNCNNKKIIFIILEYFKIIHNYIFYFLLK